MGILDDTVSYIRDKRDRFVEDSRSGSGLMKYNPLYRLARGAQILEANLEERVEKTFSEEYTKAGGLDAEQKLHAAQTPEQRIQARKEMGNALRGSAAESEKTVQGDSGVRTFSALIAPAALNSSCEANREGLQELATDVGLRSEKRSGESDPWYVSYAAFIAAGGAAIGTGLLSKGLIEGAAAWFTGGASLVTGATSRVSTLLSVGIAAGAGIIAYTLTEDAVHGSTPEEERQAKRDSHTSHLTRGVEAPELGQLTARPTPKALQGVQSIYR